MMAMVMHHQAKILLLYIVLAENRRGQKHAPRPDRGSVLDYDIYIRKQWNPTAGHCET